MGVIRCLFGQVASRKYACELSVTFSPDILRDDRFEGFEEKKNQKKNQKKKKKNKDEFTPEAPRDAL